MFDKNLLKLPRMHAVMGALVVFALLQAGCVMGWAWALTQAVCELWNGNGLDASLPYLAMFAACFIALQLVRFAEETMLDRYSVEQARLLRRRLLDRVFGADSLLSRRVGAARVVAVANDGIDEVQTYVRIIPPKIIGMVAVSLPLLVFEFSIDWVSGVILAVMFPVIIFFMVLLGRQARERSERQYLVYTRLTNQYMDTLRGMGVLKSFGATESEAGRVYDNSEDVRRATVRTLRTATLSSVVLDLCATFGVAAVAIMLAFRLMDGSLLLQTGLLALIVAPEYFAPIRSFASDYHASLDGKNALASVLEYVDDGGVAEPIADSSAHDAAQAFSGGEFESLAFHGVGYAYPTGGWGVREVSFQLGSNDKLAIVGPSGIGKTTLTNLVAGFVSPTEGRVLIDGQPVDLTCDSWKRIVRYIPQNPYVFRMSLEDNVRFYHPAATRREVEEAVRSVGLLPLVDELPQGLDTLVGEGERGLSGGEAHRLALARVLLDQNARVLVFDEPTAHLDIETERDLKEPMLAAMQGKLVVLATHRRHWLADMDCVLELGVAPRNGEGETARGEGVTS